MGQTDKGVLIFSEWFEAMNHLSSKEYKTMMNSIYRCQMHGEEPVKFQGKAALVAAIIFPSVQRRSARATAAKRAAETYKGAYGINPIIDEALRRRAQRELDGECDDD